MYGLIKVIYSFNKKLSTRGHLDSSVGQAADS